MYLQFQVQSYVSQSLVTLGSCRLLRKSVISLLLSEVNRFAEDLGPVSQVQRTWTCGPVTAGASLSPPPHPCPALPHQAPRSRRLTARGCEYYCSLLKFRKMCSENSSQSVAIASSPLCIWAKVPLVAAGGAWLKGLQSPQAAPCP